MNEEGKSSMLPIEMLPVKPPMEERLDLGLGEQAKLEPEKNPRSPEMMRMLPMMQRDLMMNLKPSANHQKPGKQKKMKLEMGEDEAKLERAKVRRTAKNKE